MERKQTNILPHFFTGPSGKGVVLVRSPTNLKTKVNPVVQNATERKGDHTNKKKWISHLRGQQHMLKSTYKGSWLRKSKALYITLLSWWVHL